MDLLKKCIQKIGFSKTKAQYFTLIGFSQIFDTTHFDHSSLKG